MKVIYPVVFTSTDEGVLVYVPDLDINTHGADLINAMDMARDAISIWCVCHEDGGHSLPEPTKISSIENKPNHVISLVDVDITAYRRMLDNRAVRKNLTIPSWLNEQAEKANVNFSQVLLKALKEELGIA